MWLRKSEVAQSCVTLCNSMECSLPGSSIHGSFQARSWSGSPVPSPFQDTNFHLKFQFSSIFIIGNRHCQLFSFKWQVHLLFPPQNVSHTQFWIGCLQSFIQVKHSVLWKEWLVHRISQSHKCFLFETVIPLYFDMQWKCFIHFSFLYCIGY